MLARLYLYSLRKGSDLIGVSLGALALVSFRCRGYLGRRMIVVVLTLKSEVTLDWCCTITIAAVITLVISAGSCIEDHSQNAALV